MVKIYTKTGDSGETSLFGGERLTKADLRIEAYGTVDELNAVLGVVRATRSVAPDGALEDLDAVLERIQQHLFVIGAELASPEGSVQGMPPTGASEVEELEKAIDLFESHLPELQQFILPGGDPLAAHLHLARCVCRRAERHVVALVEAQQTKVPQAVLIYLNRLGDLLFVMAREANRLADRADVPWSRDS